MWDVFLGTQKWTVCNRIPKCDKFLIQKKHRMIACLYVCVWHRERMSPTEAKRRRRREREKVARQRGAKIRTAPCWEAVEFPLHRRKSESSGYFCTNAEGNHSRAVIDWQCSRQIIDFWHWILNPHWAVIALLSHCYCICIVGLKVLNLSTLQYFLPQGEAFFFLC